MIELNDIAPEFTLKNTKKEDISLSDFNGQTVVLAFYPGAFTGVCDTEMCTLQDNLKSFNDLDAIVIGISVDSPWANGGFTRFDGILGVLAVSYTHLTLPTTPYE